MSSFCKTCGAWMAGDVCPACNTKAPEGTNTPDTVATTHCPGCGKRVSAKEAFCPYCGKEVNVKHQEPMVQTPQWVNPKTLKEGKMHCPHCEELVDVGVVFCPQCGKDVRKKYTSRTNCLYCGQTLEETSEFCPHCGKSVEEVPAVEEKKRLNCSKCGKELKEDSVFCPRCGMPTELGRAMGKVKIGKENICIHCQTEYSPGATFCSGCGQPTKLRVENSAPWGYPSPVQGYNVPQNPPYAMAQQPVYPQGYGAYNPYMKTPTQTLAARERASAIVWLVVTALQAIFAIFLLSNTYDYGEYAWISVAAVAIWNGVNVYHSFQRAQRVLMRTPGIVAEYEGTLVSGILFIVINAIFGGVIGIAGAIFDLVNRNYAIRNAQFLEDNTKQW